MIKPDILNDKCTSLTGWEQYIVGDAYIEVANGFHFDTGMPTEDGSQVMITKSDIGTLPEKAVNHYNAR